MVVIERFREIGRETSATFKYWDNFLKGETLICLLRAERDVCFELPVGAYILRQSRVCPMVPSWEDDVFEIHYPKGMKSLEIDQQQSFKHLTYSWPIIKLSIQCGQH